MNQFFKRTRQAVFLMGGVSIVLGVICIALGANAPAMLVSVVGWVLAIAGGAMLIRAFTTPNAIASSADLFLGLVMFVPGLVGIVFPALLVEVIFVVLGLYVIVTGLGDLAEASALRAVGVPGSTGAMVIAILTLVAGVLIVMSPVMAADLAATVVGAALLVNGVSEIVLGSKM